MEGTTQEAAAETAGQTSPRTLTFFRSDRSVGSRLSSGSLELSSNAWLLTVNQPADRQRRVVLACAALFAEDLDAHEIVVAGETDPDLRHLMGAARLAVRAC